jgi:hypothetical protein
MVRVCVHVAFFNIVWRCSLLVVWPLKVARFFSVFQSGEGIMMTGQNAAFAGPRNVASNAFLRQSPSPSALQSSPAGLGGAPPRYASVYVLTDYF